jgi:cytochrome P450
MTEQQFPSHIHPPQEDLRLPPTPSDTSRLAQEAIFQQEPLAFLRAVQQEHHDMVRLLLPEPLILVIQPDYVCQVLRESFHTYHKVESPRTQRIFGIGLITSNGSSWRRQRRLLQLTFHQRHAARWSTVAAQAIEMMLARWEPLAECGEPVDVAAEMQQLTLDILGRALFGVEVSAVSAEIGQAITTLISARQPDRAAEAERAALALEAIVAWIIETRRAGTAQHEDVLTILLRAQQEDGGFMTDALMRDEIMSLLIAGHETTAVALSWTWYLLSNHPAVERKLHQELRRVLTGAAPTDDDLLRNLRYTRMVVEESMRLYPPIWATSRVAKTDDTVGPYSIPAGAHLLLSPYLTHRHPSFWEESNRFDPERFLPERASGRPRCAHFPFGAGPRVCIGSQFAMQQMLTIIAAIAQRYRLRTVSGSPVEPEPGSSLRLHGGLPMVLDRLT